MGEMQLRGVVMSKLVLAMVVCICVGGTARAADVTSCNQVVGPSEVGDLVADLACGPGDYGVQLQHRAVLRLNGFRLTGRPGAQAVRCGLKRCAIEGPGTIAGAEVGVDIQDFSKLYVRDVVFDGNRVAIIGDQGPAYGGENSRVLATNVIIRNSTLLGMVAGLFRVDGLVLENNADRGAWVRSLRGRNVIATGNGLHGIDARQVISIKNLQATGNGGSGVHCDERVALRDSTVTGNVGLDIDALRGRLVNTACGTSSLGLCAND